MADEVTGTETSAGTETTTEAPIDAAVDATATETTDAANDAAADGSGATVLGGEGDAPDTEAAAEAVVVPDTYDLKLADDKPVDTEVLEMATPVLKELGMSQESAQKLMPFANEIATRSAAAAITQHQLDQASAFAAMNRENLENAKGDAEIGGAKWDETVALSAKALEMLGFPKGSEFRKRLNDSGFGNDPELIRAFRRIGESVSEDSFVRSDAAAAPKKSDAEILYPDMKAGE